MLFVVFSILHIPPQPTIKLLEVKFHVECIHYLNSWHNHKFKHCNKNLNITILQVTDMWYYGITPAISKFCAKVFHFAADFFVHQNVTCRLGSTDVIYQKYAKCGGTRWVNMDRRHFRSAPFFETRVPTQNIVYLSSPAIPPGPLCSSSTLCS